MIRALVILLSLCCAGHTVFADTTYVPAGFVSGQWSIDHSPYIILGAAIVAEDETLRVGPGVDIFFRNTTLFWIDGFLSARGTADSAIVWAPLPEINEQGWIGIQASPAGRWVAEMSHCSLDQGQLENQSTALFWLSGGEARLDHCALAHNRGGLKLEDSSTVTMTDCEIAGPRPNHAVGLWMQQGSQADLIRTSIHHHRFIDGPGIFTENSSLNMTDCRMYENEGGVWGGAIFAADNVTRLTGCEFFNNIGRIGGAVYSAGGAGSELRVDRCVFSANSSTEDDYSSGGAIYANSFLSDIVRSTFAYNTALTGAAIRVDRFATINSCIFYGHLREAAITAEDDYHVEHCAFFGNLADADPPEPGFGELTRVNANGDSCDFLWNIFMNPLFVDSADFHLTANSPCIDAGDEGFGLDPDSTFSEIGAYWFDQTVGAPSVPNPSVSDFRLLAPYPNPFNAVVTLRWTQPEEERIRLTVFDITGRSVARLVDARFTAGAHELQWDGRAHAAGLYFATLESDSRQEVRKAVLLK